MYSPVLVNRTHSSGSSVSNQSEYENVRAGNSRQEHGSQDSGFCSANNMYNINTQRKSIYNSTDQIKTPTNKEPDKRFEEAFDNKNTFYQQSKHGSLDGSYRKSISSNYGSLERTSKNKKRNDHYNKSDSDTSVVLANLEPSKYGSKRSSQTENDSDTHSSSSNVTEVPIYLGETNSAPYKQESSSRHKQVWQDVARAEPSPIIKSPESESKDNNLTPTGQCYSPRIHEGSFHARPDSQVSTTFSENNITKRREKRGTKNQGGAALSTALSPIISKPFEMADFYRYSEKIRRQRMIEQYQQQLIGNSRCSSPSQHSSDSGDAPSPGSVYYHNNHYQNQSRQSPSGSNSPQSSYRSGPSSTYSSRQTSPYLPHKRVEKYEQSSSPFPSHVSPKFVKEQSTHVQYSVSTSAGSRVYKSVQTTTHTQYKPLNPLKCDPINSSSSSSSASTPSTPSSSSAVQSRINTAR